MENKKILVVEDEIIVAEDLVQTLRSLGYDVPEFVSNGEDAIKKTKELKPDLVLMDIMIEGSIDGIETAEIINTDLNIPIVYLTAYSSSNIIDRAKKSKPFGYIVKPFDETNLYTTIEIAIYKHKFQQNLIFETENAIASILGCIEFISENSDKLNQEEFRNKIKLILNSTNIIKNSIEQL